MKNNLRKNSIGGGRGRIKTLLDGALSAGKAVRNEKVVPEIKKLKEYGDDGSPPAELVSTVAEVSEMRCQFLLMHIMHLFHSLLLSLSLQYDFLRNQP